MPRSEWPPDLARAVRAVWSSIPAPDRAALAAVRYRVFDDHEPEIQGRLASAGGGLIYLRADLVENVGEAAAKAAIAHELAHELLNHSRLVGYSEAMRAHCEEAADELAARWLGWEARAALQQLRTRSY
jgi:Zn-dependent protease with chaperone function